MKHQTQSNKVKAKGGEMKEKSMGIKELFFLVLQNFCSLEGLSSPYSEKCFVEMALFPSAKAPYNDEMPKG